ncbi:MAG: corrinoid protein [Anaerolineales bacterium]|nr:corrinoid protein [Anaerolineales bacterium]
MTTELLSQITGSLVDGDPELTVDLTKQALQAGIEPMTIIEGGLVPGMNIVGEKFSAGEYFLPHLIISASGMQQAMDLLEPELHARSQQMKVSGKVVIGTVQGDIHEIGKSLVATMLSASGFQVYDLGVDVPAEAFIAKVKETGAQLVGLSALLTTTMVVQKEIIEALSAAGLRDQVKVMVGGAPVTRGWVAEIGADGYAEDAIGAVQLATQLVAV